MCWPEVGEGPRLWDGDGAGQGHSVAADDGVAGAGQVPRHDRAALVFEQPFPPSLRLHFSDEHHNLVGAQFADVAR
jgi:hypothetical protein